MRNNYFSKKYKYYVYYKRQEVLGHPEKIFRREKNSPYNKKSVQHYNTDVSQWCQSPWTDVEFQGYIETYPLDVKEISEAESRRFIMAQELLK